MDLPFLGIHVSHSADGSTNLGPTAIPAWGRENYKELEDIEPIMALEFLKDMAWLVSGGVIPMVFVVIHMNTAYMESNHSS